jgi:hypothetical protein
MKINRPPPNRKALDELVERLYSGVRFLFDLFH